MNSALGAEGDNSSLGSLQEDAARAAKLMAFAQMTTSKILDIRQPLSVVATDCGTGLRLLQNGVSDADKFRTLFERISDCVNWANGLIAELDEAISSRSTHKAAVNVGELISNAVRFVTCESISRGVKVRNDFGTDTVNVLGDKDQLTQALLGLIVCLIRSMRHTSEAELLLMKEREDQFVRVRMTIAIERVQTSRPLEVFGGEGLVESSAYLEACKAIICVHHGDMSSIENEREFGFAITLPLLHISQINDQ